MGRAAEEPRREAVHRRAELEEKEPEPEWKQELRRRLEQKVSFEFVKTPLCKAIEYVSNQAKINMVLDPNVQYWDKSINLKARDLTLKMALDWIGKLGDVEYTLRDGAVFLSATELPGCGPSLRVYELRDLAMRVPDHPGPEIDLLGSVAPREPGRGTGDHRDVAQPFIGTGALAEMIRTGIHPHRWNPKRGTTVEGREGRLVVMHGAEVHHLISEFLDKLRVQRRLQARVGARLLAASEKLLKELQALEKPGDGTAFLRQQQLDLLANALETGEEASPVDAASLTCLNGQRTHTLSGRAFERREKGTMQFRGTILDVRPMVSFDRKYVTMHLRLTRIEGGEHAGEPVQVFKFSTTVTCLDTDTVLLAGASLPDGRRLVALVTPTILHLEPAPEE